MTTVAELKKFLKQFPNDAEVEFVVRASRRDWAGDTAIAVKADLDDYGNWDFTDFTKNDSVKEGHPAFGRKILTLGED